jgi:glutaredoxin-like protein NrdH
MVIVYTKNNCQLCRSTKNELSRKGIDYKEVNIELDSDAFDKIVKMNYKSVPIVVTNDDSWSGFRIDKINAL